MRAAIVGCIAVLIGCGAGDARETPPVPAITLPPDLAQVLRSYEAAYSRRDSSALAALFATDGILLPLGESMVRGGAEVSSRLAREGGSLSLVPVAYGAADSIAWIVGTFGAERSASTGGKFVLALRRDSAGTWRVAADIANPNGR